MLLPESGPSEVEKPSLIFKKQPKSTILLDIGTQYTRIGVSTDPTPLHVFPTKVAKFRDRKSGEQRTVVGNDIFLEQMARNNAKSPFEGPLLVNWDALESILDYSFELIGYQGNSKLLMSIPPLYPNLIVSTLQELVEKGYKTTLKLKTDIHAAALDAAKSGDITNFLHIHMGSEAVYITPVVKKQPLLEDCKRINWAGRHAVEYLQDLLVLKYPTFPQPVTQNEVQSMFEKYCYAATNYKDELHKFDNVDQLAELERIVQMQTPEKPEVDQSQIDKITERRKESGRRLQEKAAIARQQKQEQQTEELRQLSELVGELDQMDESKANNHAVSLGYAHANEVRKSHRQLDVNMRRARGEVIEDKEPDTPLLQVPDDQLNEQELAAKRRQKLLRANYDARQRMKQEKQEKEEAEQKAKQDEENWRNSDLKGWSQSKRARLQEITNLIKERETLRSDSRLRFRQSLEITEGSAKRKETEDEAIARLVETEAENEPENLDAEAEFLKGELLEFDPEFNLEEFEGRKDWRESTINKFLWGAHPYDPDSIEQQYQLNLNIERIRAAEPLFDPSMVGLDQTGISESSTQLLLRHPELENHVVFTGGLANLKGLSERLLTDLTANLPENSGITMFIPPNPEFAVFRGLVR